MLRLCILSENDSQRTNILAASTTVRTNGVRKRRRWPPAAPRPHRCPAPGDLPFSNTRRLPVRPCILHVFSLLLLPHPPKPYSLLGFKNHLFHAVFPDLLMLNMHCWWTGEPPNPVLRPPLLSTSLSLLLRRPLLLD